MNTIASHIHEDEQRMSAVEQRMSKTINAVGERMAEHINDVEYHMTKNMNAVQAQMFKRMSAIEERLNKKEGRVRGPVIHESVIDGELVQQSSLRVPNQLQPNEEESKIIEGIFKNLSKGKKYFFGGNDNIDKLVIKGFVIDFWMDDVDYINNPPQIYKQYYCHGYLVNGQHIPTQTDRPCVSRCNCC